MRIRRRLTIPLIVLLIVAAIALIVVLRKHAPPEAARLLPGADGFFYINLKWIRTFSANQLPPVSREPEYQKFVEETGFQFERDLDQAAFAIHYPQAWGNGSAGTATEPRFSEVFVGKIDSGRLTAYLKKLSSSIDDYRGFDIYNIPFEGRTVRVVILSYDSVAISNHPNPDVIRGIPTAPANWPRRSVAPGCCASSIVRCRWRVCLLRFCACDQRSVPSADWAVGASCSRTPPSL